MIIKRLISIDIARSLCIILVVIGHYHPENSPQWYDTVIDVIYSFHMPLFLFASGYVYRATYKPMIYRNFIWRKFQRLMIPYFFVSLVIITIKIFTEQSLMVENPVSLSVFYQLFYLPAAAYFLWFVFVLFLCFLIIPFFDTRKKLTALLAAASILYLLPLDFPKLFCLSEFKNCLFWFVLGCNLVEWIKIRQYINKVPVCAALLFFTGLFAAKNFADTAVFKTMITVCLALSGIIFISRISKWIEKKTSRTKSVLLNVSVYSYTIYLFHTTFEGFAKALIAKLPIPDLSNGIKFNLIFLIYVIIVISAGVISPVILHKLITKYSKLFSYLIGTKYSGKKK
jgi:fucose 4-O-acetylase-like acetyltransferase